MRTRVLVKKPKGEILLGKPSLTLDSNTKMDLQEMRSKGADWIGLTNHGNELRVL